MQYVNLGEQGVYATNNHALSSHLLETEKTVLVMDLGNGSLSKLLAVHTLEEVTAIVLSHLHFDHICDLFILNYALGRIGRKIDVYIPQNPAEMNNLVRKNGQLTVHEYGADDKLNIGEFQIDFAPMTHPIETYAVRCRYRGKTVVYTGDTNYNGTIAAFAEKADLLIADAALLENELSPKSLHLSAKQAARIAAEATVGKLILSHKIPTTDDGQYLAEAKQVFAETEVATELRPIEV